MSTCLLIKGSAPDPGLDRLARGYFSDSLVDEPGFSLASHELDIQMLLTSRCLLEPQAEAMSRSTMEVGAWITGRFSDLIWLFSLSPKLTETKQRGHISFAHFWMACNFIMEKTKKRSQQLLNLSWQLNAKGRKCSDLHPPREVGHSPRV